jgi:DUF3071 family protein
VQRLHVVGITDDREGLILSARPGTKSGGWSVAVDADFEEAVAELLKERGAEAESRIPRAESQLSVREMQQRLRAGQSIKQVARAAGVHDEWVERFAVPVQAEQQQVVRQAHELSLVKARHGGTSGQHLGMSVWWNLLDRSVNLPGDEWDQGWSAYLIRDNVWVVRFEYDARKRHQVAEWEVDLKTGVVTSRNRHGTDLGFIEPGRRRRPSPPPPIAGGMLTRAAPVEAPKPKPLPEPEEVDEPAAPKKKAVAQKKAVAKKKAPQKLPATRKKVPLKRAPAPARARRR